MITRRKLAARVTRTLFLQKITQQIAGELTPNDSIV